MAGKLERILKGFRRGIITAGLASSLLLFSCSEDTKPTAPAKTTEKPVPTAQNRLPVIISSPITSVNENEYYGYQIVATDADGDALTCSLIERPSWLTISGNVISGTAPEVLQNQSANAKIKVSDGRGGDVEQAWPLIVKNNSNTYVLDGNNLGKLSSVGESSLIFSESMSFSLNDIIGAGISNKTPDGFLRKITSVSSDKRAFQTEQATLEEAVKNGSFAFKGRITPNGVVNSKISNKGAYIPASPSSFDFNVDIDNKIIYDFDGNLATTNDQLKANGNISFGLDYELSGDITNLSLEKLIFILKATGKYDLKMNSMGSFGWFSKNIDIKEFPLPPVTIGYIPLPPPLFPISLPITVHPKVVFSVGFSGGIKILETRVSQEATFTAGLTYEKGQWKPIFSPKSTFQFDPFTWVYPNLSFEAHAGPTIKFPLWNVAGPKGSLFGNLKFDAIDTRWSLYGGLEAILGVEMKVFKHVLADFTAPVFKYERLLIEGQINQPPPPPPPPSLTGKIAFDRVRGSDSEVYLINPDGSNETNLTNNATNYDITCSWSPDATKILYISRPSSTSDFDIWVMNSDGSNKTKLTGGSSMDEDSPVFSPDGKKIAYSAGYNAGYYQIYIMNSNGSSPVDITKDYSHYYWDLDWSPNSRIAFYSNRDNSNGEIYTMNSNGLDIRRLTNTSSYDRSPSWSPDGTKIVFDSNRDGNSEVYVMNANGSNQTNISRSPNTYESNPSWSPDGKKIVYISGQSINANESKELWIMNADGSGKVRITNNNYYEDNPSWSQK